MHIPDPDPGIIARRADIVARLRQVLPADAVIDDATETRAYECDALSAYRCPPLAVILPRTTAEVAAALKVCHEEGVPVVPRGAGTSLAGGAMPTADAVILGIARMNRVLEVDYADRVIGVEAGRHQPVCHRRGGRPMASFMPLTRPRSWPVPLRATSR